MTFTYIHHHYSIRQIIRKNIIGPLFDTLGTGLYKYHKVVSIFCSVQVCFNPNVTARLHFELLLSLWLFSITSHEHFSCTTDSVWFTVYRQCDLWRTDAIPYVYKVNYTAASAWVPSSLCVMCLQLSLSEMDKKKKEEVNVLLSGSAIKREYHKQPGSSHSFKSHSHHTAFQWCLELQKNIFNEQK